MNITTTIRVVYDPAKDGTLRQFREKFNKMRDHVLTIQAKGLIPSGDIYWVTSTLKAAPEPDNDEPPTGQGSGGVVLDFPALVHTAGTRMDLNRLAA